MYIYICIGIKYDHIELDIIWKGVTKVGKSIQVIVQQYIKCATVPCIYKAFHFFSFDFKRHSQNI